MWDKTPFPCSWQQHEAIFLSAYNTSIFTISSTGISGASRERAASHKAVKPTTLHPVNTSLFICPSLHAQSYYLGTSSKRQPSGSPYKIYTGNVTFNDWSEEKNEGWEEWNTAGCFKGIISYICAFPEVIIEWQWLGGNPFLSLGKDCSEKDVFVLAACNGCQKMKQAPSSTADPLVYGVYIGAENNSKYHQLFKPIKNYWQPLVMSSPTRLFPVVVYMSASITWKTNVCMCKCTQKVTFQTQQRFRLNQVLQI